MAAPRKRTSVPGVYSRGSYWCVLYRDASGRQRQRSFPTFELARDFREGRERSREALARSKLEFEIGQRPTLPSERIQSAFVERVRYAAEAAKDGDTINLRTALIDIAALARDWAASL